MPLSNDHLLPGGVFWERCNTHDFAARSHNLAVLPIYGVSSLGLGLGWDAEEKVGNALLASSLKKQGNVDSLTVLPTVRMSLAPYQPAISAVDPETFMAVIRDQAEGIKRSGFKKLVFWSTHPWNSEIVDVVSRDIRIDYDLQTFVVELGGLGLSFHPRTPKQRTRAHCLAEHLSPIEAVEEASGEPTDAGFRPGNWTKLPAIISERTAESPADILTQASDRLAGLWNEIINLPEWGSEATDEADTPNRRDDSPGSQYEVQDPLTRYNTPQIQAAAGNKNTLVIIPVGATEQHGPHMPVGVDTIIAKAAAQGLKQRLGESVLIAPTQSYGKSNEHTDFAGTVSLSANSLRRLLKDQIRNLNQLGFQQFAVLNTHGGNSSVLVYTLREIQTELGVRAGMLRLPISNELTEQERTWGFHAGEWETSVMLAIAPELVRMDRAVCHYPAHLDDAGELRPENAPAIFSWKSRDIAPDGVMGDATLATAEKGQRWLNEALDLVAEQIRQLPPI